MASLIARFATETIPSGIPLPLFASKYIQTIQRLCSSVDCLIYLPEDTLISVLTRVRQYKTLYETSINKFKKYRLEACKNSRGFVVVLTATHDSSPLADQQLYMA